MMYGDLFLYVRWLGHQLQSHAGHKRRYWCELLASCCCVTYCSEFRRSVSTSSTVFRNFLFCFFICFLDECIYYRWWVKVENTTDQAHFVDWIGRVRPNTRRVCDKFTWIAFVREEIIMKRESDRWMESWRDMYTWSSIPYSFCTDISCTHAWTCRSQKMIVKQIWVKMRDVSLRMPHA